MHPGIPSRPEAPSMDVLVRTFNSERHLDDALGSARRFLPIRRLIVVDRRSTDRTVSIARQFGAEVYEEDTGLGFATTEAVRRADAEYVTFLDSDVTVRDPGFAAEAVRQLQDPNVGAVVGCALGHRFIYGLPLSLTTFRRTWVSQVPIPAYAQGRETYYIQRALARAALRVRYVLDAMEHRSVYRGPGWAEWQGAQTRAAAGLSPREVGYSGAVILLMHMNSRNPAYILYSPIFFGRFLRGFLAPQRFLLRDRRALPVP